MEIHSHANPDDLAERHGYVQPSPIPLHQPSFFNYNTFLLPIMFIRLRDAQF